MTTYNPNHIPLAGLLESVNQRCIRYNVRSLDAIAKYLIANAEFTGWDISPECLNDFVTAIRNNVEYTDFKNAK